jgi:hypothetical protein
VGIRSIAERGNTIHNIAEELLITGRLQIRFNNNWLTRDRVALGTDRLGELARGTAQVAVELARAQVAVEPEHDRVVVEPEHVLEVVELERVLEAVELERVPVAAGLAQGHPRGRLAVAPTTKSVTAAHRRGLVPLLAAEDLAVAAVEITREPAAAEAVIAWEVADTVAAAEE